MTPGRRAEADYATLVFHASLVELGVQVTLETLREWESVSTSPARIASSVGAFLATLLNLVSLRRAEARLLTYAYLRYHRALHTGYTFPVEGEGESETSLSSLRTEFYSQVEDLTPDLLGDDDSISDANGVVTEPPPAVDAEVDVESLELPDENDLDDQAEDEVKAQVINSAERSLRNHIEGIKSPKGDDPDEIAQKVAELIDEAHETAGSLAAGAAQRAVVNTGREVQHELVRTDRRVMAYVRLSRTGTPCGWCAMLISRGPVYKSAETAEGADGETYHPNCQCYSVAVYSDEHFDESPLFDLNRELEDEWGEVTRGLSGKAAIAAFRLHIRKKYQRPGGAAENPSPGGTT